MSKVVFRFREFVVEFLSEAEKFAKLTSGLKASIKARQGLSTNKTITDRLTEIEKGVDLLLKGNLEQNIIKLRDRLQYSATGK